MLSGASLLFGMTAVLWAQAPGRLEFEVASIKPAAPMTGGMFRVGMRTDKGRVNYENVALKDLIRTAYRLKDYQVVGPDWLDAARFDIVAKISEGHDEKQAPEMLQSLLEDRFKIAVHHESKPHDTYVLLVGKSGPKLTPWEEGKNDNFVLPDGTKMTVPAPPPPPPPGSEGAGAKGGVERSSTRITISDGGGGGGMGGGAGFATTNGGGMHMQLRKQTLDQFAESLARFLGSPVTNLTEIPGEYNFNLEVSPSDMQRGSGMSLPKMMGAASPCGGRRARRGQPGGGRRRGWRRSPLQERAGLWAEAGKTQSPCGPAGGGPDRKAAHRELTPKVLSVP